MEQHLKQAGLIGLVDPDDPAVHAGVVEVDDGWQVAQDPATNDFGVPDMAAQLAAVECPVTLAGLGHNPHVEDPQSVAALVAAYA